jgi:hypothetical protein
MEEYTWRSLVALLGPGTRVVGVAVFCRAMASEDDAIRLNTAATAAAAATVIIEPEKRSSMIVSLKGVTAMDPVQRPQIEALSFVQG